METCQVELDSVFRWDDGVVVGVKEECRWSVFGHLSFIRQGFDQSLWWFVAQQVSHAAFVSPRASHADNRIAEHGKIGSAAYAIDRIIRIRVSRIEMRCCRGGEVSASRESENSYPSRIEIPFLGSRSQCAQGALSVKHWVRMLVTSTSVAPAAVSIHAYRTSDSILLQPLSNIVAFIARCQTSVPASGQHNDRRSPAGSRGMIDRQIRFISRLIATGPRGSVWPKQ